MEKQYLLSVDQSTQGTKALLFDQEGNLICRGDRPHRQIINDAGWVSHDLNEIYSNTLKVVRDVIEKAGIRREQVAGLGISNQRETSAVWDRTAIRWQMPLCGSVPGQRISVRGWRSPGRRNGCAVQQESICLPTFRHQNWRGSWRT